MIKKILAIIAAACVTLSVCAFAACATSDNGGKDQSGNQQSSTEGGNNQNENEDGNDQNGNEGGNDQNGNEGGNDQNGNEGENDQNGNEDGNDQNAAIENGHKIVYVFTSDSEVMTITEKSSMYDYMCALKDDGFLSFEGSDGDYGFYVTSVMGVTSKVVSSTANSYSGWDWAVYTTVTELDGVIYSGDESTTIDGITLYKASYGVSGVPCIEGESYALVYELSTMTW